MAEWSLKPSYPCPYCGSPNEAATGVTYTDTRVPEKGSVAVCAYCANVGVFTGRGLEARLPTEAERAVIMADPGVRGLLALLVSSPLFGERHT